MEPVIPRVVVQLHGGGRHRLVRRGRIDVHRCGVGSAEHIGRRHAAGIGDGGSADLEGVRHHAADAADVHAVRYPQYRLQEVLTVGEEHRAPEVEVDVEAHRAAGSHGEAMHQLEAGLVTARDGEVVHAAVREGDGVAGGGHHQAYPGVVARGQV